MSNGAAAAYRLTSIRQALDELDLSDDELHQIGALLDVFKRRRQPHLLASLMISPVPITVQIGHDVRRRLASSDRRKKQ